MKPLQLMKPTIFLICGIPGAGKSYFTRQFAASQHLPKVSADRIRFELFGEPDFSPAEQTTVQRMVAYMASELLIGRRSFIVDAPLTNIKLQRMKINKLARENGYEVLTVWVQTDAITSKERSFKRNPTKTDDKYNKPLSPAIFESQLKQFTSPINEAHVVVSGKHTFAAQQAIVLKKLSSKIVPLNLSNAVMALHDMPLPPERHINPVHRNQRRINVG